MNWLVSNAIGCNWLSCSSFDTLVVKISMLLSLREQTVSLVHSCYPNVIVLLNFRTMLFNTNMKCIDIANQRSEKSNDKAVTLYVLPLS